ncbi:hypothetical protein D5018_16650 [Parashewanella curva]|uniref:Uncharacterized protein n=1 Tax=Parashewanella curva TaxID=2338552 RepID=A0A3L8PUS0_9GAMM|nr:hypothetical protein [Parashewanella curva]RLV58569.1 hypothetical protein D5018_16650 [Parashewanella curva]
MIRFPLITSMLEAVRYLRSPLNTNSAANRQERYQLRPTDALSQPVEQFHSGSPITAVHRSRHADSSQIKTPAYKVSSKVVNVKAETTKQANPTFKTERTIMKTVTQVMGGNNPALWQPRKFITKIVLRHEDDLFLQFGKLCVKKLKSGCPLPMVGINHTFSQMITEIDQYLQVKTLKHGDRLGLENFKKAIIKTQAKNSPYLESLRLCLKFPLMQQFFYMRYAHEKKQWDDALLKLDIDRNIPDFLSIDDIIHQRCLGTAPSTLNEFKNRLQNVSNLTNIDFDPDNPLSLIYIDKDLFEHSGLELLNESSELKIYFYSFEEFSIPEITHFSFTPFVPVSLVRAPILFLHGMYHPCSYPPFHDKQHDLLIKSHIPDERSFNVCRGYHLVIEPKLSPELQQINETLLFFWFHDSGENKKRSIYHVSDFQYSEDYVLSLTELFETTLDTWEEVPERQSLVMSDALIKGIIFFAYVYQFDNKKAFSIRDVDAIVECEYQKIISHAAKIYSGKQTPYTDWCTPPLFCSTLTYVNGELEPENPQYSELWSSAKATYESVELTEWNQLNIQQKLKLTYFLFQHAEVLLK